MLHAAPIDVLEQKLALGGEVQLERLELAFDGGELLFLLNGLDVQEFVAGLDF